MFDCMPRAAEAIGALSGWVQAGRIRNKVDVLHGLENAPATLRRLFDGRNQGRQLPRRTASLPAFRTRHSCKKRRNTSEPASAG